MARDPDARTTVEVKLRLSPTAAADADALAEQLDVNRSAAMAAAAAAALRLLAGDARGALAELEAAEEARPGARTRAEGGRRWAEPADDLEGQEYDPDQELPPAPEGSPLDLEGRRIAARQAGERDLLSLAELAALPDQKARQAVTLTRTSPTTVLVEERSPERRVVRSWRGPLVPGSHRQQV